MARRTRAMVENSRLLDRNVRRVRRVSWGMRTEPAISTSRAPRPRVPRTAIVAVSAALAAAGLAGCGPAVRAPAQTVEGLRFHFTAERVEWDNSTGHPYRDPSGHTYRIDLILSDAKTGARIPGAKVSVNILGLGHAPGTSVVTLRPATVAGGPGYSHNLAFPYASIYRLTFSATLPGGHHTPVKAAFAFQRPR